MSMFPREELAKLETEFPQLQNAADYVKELGGRFYACCRCEPDKNSLYRTFARGLLEHFCQPFTDVEELEVFYRKLFYSELRIPGDQYLDSFLLVLQTLWDLIDEKRSFRSWEVAARLLECEEFMQAFIKVLRCRAFEGIRTFQPVEVYSKDGDGWFESILNMDSEVDECDLWGLSCAFDVNIVRSAPYGESYDCKFVSKREGEPKLLLHVGILGGHYFLLYPRELKALENEPRDHSSSSMKRRYLDIAYAPPR